MQSSLRETVRGPDARNVAQRVCRFLYDELYGPMGSEHALCACYKTHSYGLQLDADLQSFARTRLVSCPARATMRFSRSWRRLDRVRGIPASLTRS